MGIGDVFSKVWSFIAGAGPIVMELRGVIEYAARLFQIGMNSGDVSKCLIVSKALREIAGALRGMADEMEDVAAATERAVAADGPGGRDVTGAELMEFAGEADDLLPASRRLMDVLQKSASELKAAL